MDDTNLGPAVKARPRRRETPHHQPQIPISQRDLLQSTRLGHASRKIGLVIADSRPLLRLGLRAMLAGESGLSIRGEAGTLAEAVAKAERVRPDLLFLDYRIFDGSDDQAGLLSLKNSGTRIVIMNGDKRVATFRNAMKVGAHAFVQEDVSQIELVRTIRRVARGDAPFNAVAVTQTPRVPRKARSKNDCTGIWLLSPQQRRILPLIAEGKTNHEIALEMVLADRTIKNYVADIFKKLKINRRTKAAAVYLQARSRMRFGKTEYES